MNCCRTRTRISFCSCLFLNLPPETVENFATTLQVAFDAGAKRILIPISSAVDIATVPPELFAKFQVSFYSDPVNAVFKALGVQ